MSYRDLEIGLPFFDDINKQCRNKPYFTSYLAEWISIKDRFPGFQFYVPVDDLTITDFDLVNVNTGVSTSYLTHFLAEATSYSGDISKWWVYDGSTALSVTPANGRYYFYVKSTDGVEKYSEVFLMTSETFTEPFLEDFINIGLPIFNSIDRQVSRKPYFNTHTVNWLSANNRFPNFQFNDRYSSSVTTFSLVNSETGVSTDFLTHFNTYAVKTVIDSGDLYSYMGNEDVSVANGRYYFYIATPYANYYSEEFTMCGGLSATDDYLLLDSVDILLLDSTDKLIIG